jgi:hypothetical protein
VHQHGACITRNRRTVYGPVTRRVDQQDSCLVENEDDYLFASITASYKSLSRPPTAKPPFARERAQVGIAFMDCMRVARDVHAPGVSLGDFGDVASENSLRRRDGSKRIRT